MTPEKNLTKTKKLTRGDHLRGGVNSRHAVLEELGFKPTSDEVLAHHNAVVLMAVCPIVFLIVVPALEWGSIMLYYGKCPF